MKVESPFFEFGCLNVWPIKTTPPPSTTSEDISNIFLYCVFFFKLALNEIIYNVFLSFSFVDIGLLD